MSGLDLPPTFLYAAGYVCLLAAALLVVNVLLNRLTREERRRDRARRQRHARRPDGPVSPQS